MNWIGQVNFAGVVKAFADAQKQIAFGTARGLTFLARDASRTVNATMAQRFSNPTPFTQQAAAFHPAKRERLVSAVFIKDIQAGYLALEETGGVRLPRRGSPINVPVGQRVNQYGNLPRGAIARIRSKADVFVSDGKSKGMRHLPAGLYQRHGRVKGKGKQRAPKLLIAFERSARYVPRFRFRETVGAYVATNGRATLVASIRQALATAR